MCLTNSGITAHQNLRIMSKRLRIALSPNGIYQCNSWKRQSRRLCACRLDSRKAQKGAPNPSTCTTTPQAIHRNTLQQNARTFARPCRIDLERSGSQFGSAFSGERGQIRMSSDHCFENMAQLNMLQGRVVKLQTDALLS
jgi:hypothetical protein